MHPGSGKSIVACAILVGLFYKSGFVRGLVLVPTLELRAQWKKVFKEWGFGPAEEPAVVTYAWATRHLEDDDFWKKYEFIILDEMHHVANGPVYRRILLPVFQAQYALGLTSTPPESPLNPARRVLPIIYRRELSQGLEEGFAAPLEVVEVPVELSIDERVEYQELTDKIRVRFQRLGDVSLQEAMKSRNPTAVELKKAIQRRKRLVTMAENKVTELKRLVEDIIEREGPSRILVWSEFISMLDRCHKALSEAGIRAAVIHGELKKKERQSIMEGWGKDFRVLFAAKLMEEGVDFPEVAHGIILAGARTKRQNLQRIGRLLRPFPGKYAKVYIIHAVNTMEHRIMETVGRILR